ncbi:hypothetical protein E3Q17_03159 [Wallemia mellicola]|uniref:Uncharacterized protein n=1 Tax=Wallemia mellicola TaxID=1708541 RepID=A0A4T0NLQ9_9BASI|nr:hypothetical protein E3Q19_02783 [Wallemia mellicola]TIB98094.1 hypothetical protein E3Q17_03159 [Wallemia mellicola]TIC73523.1 hypothetical protein E3Q00_02876 [Wallemia mellicola]
MFRLDTKALPDINMDWSQSQGGQSMVGSFLGQLTIKPQTDPEGRITFSGKEIPNVYDSNSDLNFSTFTNNKNVRSE